MDLDDLSGARITKEMGDYAVELMSGSEISLTVMLDGSVPGTEAIRAWRALRERFGQEVMFESEVDGDALFSFSDA